MSGFKGVDCYKKAAPSGRLLRGVILMKSL